VGPRPGLDAVEKRQSHAPTENKTATVQSRAHRHMPTELSRPHKRVNNRCYWSSWPAFVCSVDGTIFQGKVHLIYGPRDVIHCVGNFTEGKSL
jgi:hypothetical protein